MQDGSDGEGPPGEELLFTSPLRLLLAIDGELSTSTTAEDGRRGVDSAQRFLDSGDALAPAERRRRLQELRDDVQRSWDAQSASAGRGE